MVGAVAVVCAVAAGGCGQSKGHATHGSSTGTGGSQTATTAANSSKQPTVSLGHFAGYRWTGKVTEVSARITVPKFLGVEVNTAAASWIGVEGYDGSRLIEFVQVGVNLGQLPNDGAGDAFWSDVAHHFHPVQLFWVKSGDQLVVRMTVRSGRWQLQISDLRSGAHRTILTDDRHTAGTAYAEWLQEDVGAGGSHSVVTPYPKLTAVRFADVKVNGQTPAAGSVLSQWMTARGSYIGTSPMRSDAFVIEPVKTSMLGNEYLAIATEDDNAVEKLLDHQLPQWTATTPAAVVNKAGRELKVLELSSFARIERLSLPPKLATLLRMRHVIVMKYSDILIGYRRGPTAYQSMMAWLPAQSVRLRTLRIKIRTALGLPTDG